jgi:hypothetical protein
MKAYLTILAAMLPTAETEIKEIRDLVIGLREEIRVGFAQVNTKFAEMNGSIQTLDQKVGGIDDRLKSQDIKLTQIDTKQRDMNILFTEMKGELKIVRQPIEFWEFVKRAVVSGLTVTVVGGLLLAAWKLVIFGTIKV